MGTLPPWNRSSRLALLAGTCSSLVTVVLFAVVFPAYDYDRTPVWGLLWYAAGTFFLSAGPVFFFLRRRIVAPVVVAAGLYLGSVVLTWNRITSAHEDGAALHGGPTSLAFLLMFWVVPFLFVALLGGSEFAVKRLFRRYRSSLRSGG